jgi:hypothetical protein
MNLLNHFGQLAGYSVAICTYRNDKGLVEFSAPPIQFSRTQFPNRRLTRFRRLVAFLQFPLVALWKMVCFRPDVVLYIEPHSSFPATLFGIINYRHRLLIHYHEYYEPDHFQSPGMRLIAFYHWFEKKLLFRRAVWISHTNEKRLELFHRDHPSIDPVKLRVMGNFPPASWRKESLEAKKLLVASGELLVARDKLREASGELLERPSLRLVYVGSVSLHDTFIGPLVEWILARGDDAVTLDVFAYNADEKTKEFLREAGGGRREAGGELEQAGGWRLEAGGELEQAGGWRLEAGGCRLQTSGSGLPAPESPLPSPDSGLPTPISGLTPPASRLKPAPRVRYFEQGVEYDRLPEVLANYDVGVILYRCNTTNYKFNASNKLFEYLACGLEVWFPPQMLGVKPYARDDAFPRVMEVDYEKLDTVDLEKMRDTQGLPDAPPPPCCEDEFEKLLAVMRGC